MSNEFQRVMDSTIGNIPFTIVFDDILVASKGSFTEHKNIIHKFFLDSDDYNFAVK